MKFLFILILPLAIFCTNNHSKNSFSESGTPSAQNVNTYYHIIEIPVPPGYNRISIDSDSFGAWLRSLPLKRNKTVYLFNGLPKKNQSAQYAVIDIPIGTKDLQQCADAVMRLRAEYFYSKKEFERIGFSDNADREYCFRGGSDRRAFDKYLEKVFAMCGTLSLEKELYERDIKDIEIGDVFIKGGSPGHAMIVVDIAKNKKGEKIFLLAQSYMPAQDIHVVKNPSDDQLSPWFAVVADRPLYTPEWIFKPTQLRHF